MFDNRSTLSPICSAGVVISNDRRNARRSRCERRARSMMNGKQQQRERNAPYTRRQHARSACRWRANGYAFVRRSVCLNSYVPCREVTPDAQVLNQFAICLQDQIPVPPHRSQVRKGLQTETGSSGRIRCAGSNVLLSAFVHPPPVSTQETCSPSPMFRTR